jgi:hypothetical protein
MTPSEVYFFSKKATQRLLISVAFCSLVLLNIKTMGKLCNLSGKIYGRLTVISRAENKGRYVAWNCLCECGKKKIVPAFHLKDGHTKSCGCYLVEFAGNLKRTHSDNRSKEHQTWNGIKKRCLNPNEPAYKHYGARGITVCDRWLESYSNFLSDMGRAPSKRHSIDRINTNGNYEASNCRWATPKEQANNKRNTTYLEYNGQNKTIVEWCEFTGINYRAIRSRLRYGWSIEKTLTTPIDA